MAGIPPLAGFIGKFYLFAAVVKGKLFFLAILAAGNTVISLYYYVRIMKEMFISEPEGDLVEKVAAGVQFKKLGAVLTIVTVVPTLVLGVFWGQLAQWVQMRVM